jgi:MoaA/NifB/PqqE/SkfB family radical SAM enzyme
VEPTSFLWLEVTGRCQLACRQCYADSGPSGTHGLMTRADWVRVLDEAAVLGVEVFTNLVHVTDEMWEVFARPRVSLATSYYSDDPAQHAAVTGRPSYPRTKANITEAVRRGIPLRAGVIDLGNGQRAGAAQTELVELGVPEIGYDRVRQVGRGVRDRQASTEQLCGHCGDGSRRSPRTARSGRACSPAGCRSATSSTTRSPRSSLAPKPSGCGASWRRRSPDGTSPRRARRMSPRDRVPARRYRPGTARRAG